MQLIILVASLVWLFALFVYGTKNTHYIFTIIAFLYLTPFATNIQISGIGLPLVIEVVLLVIFSVKFINQRDIIAFKWSGHKDVVTLLIFFILLLFSHIFFGDYGKVHPRSYTAPAIIHMSIMIAAIAFGMGHYKHPEPMLKIIMWMLRLNVYIGLVVMLFGNYVGHEKIIIDTPVTRQIGFNPNELAIIAIILIVIELFLIKKGENNPIMLLVPILTNLLTVSRGGIILLSLTLVIWFIKGKRVVIPILFSFAIIALIIQTPDIEIINRFTEIEQEHGGVENLKRYKLLMRGILVFLDNPVFGIGVGSFYKTRMSYGIEYYGGKFGDAHNMYVQVLLETGIIGGIIFAIFVYHLIRNIQRLKYFEPRLYSFAITLLFVFLSSAMFTDDVYRFSIYLPIFVISWYAVTQYRITHTDRPLNRIEKPIINN
ncbi:MAG: O-antigen ligase family protein [Bacteroidetes bacterium]|nr:O-antigen ligase family protein [Bacteroidota bacterium]